MINIQKDKEKKLLRQRNAWKIRGGKNFDGDVNKLYSKLEIIKDINFPTNYVNRFNNLPANYEKKLYNLDINNNLYKIKYNLIYGDRGWKKTNNSLFNKKIFDKTNFDKTLDDMIVYNINTIYRK